MSLAVPDDCAGLRIDQVLARLLPEHSRSRLQGWLKAGRITLDGRAPDAKRKVWGGERVVVRPDSAPEVLTNRPEAIPLRIVYEDATLLVVDKPAGLVVHPGSGNPSGTLLNALLHHAPALKQLPRAGIVHRLDKDTSGLLAVAKTAEAQTDLVRQLQARTVKRCYLAVVHGEVAEPGVVDAAIGRHPRLRTRMAVVADGRASRTRFRIHECFRHATLLECELDTGRTHQIRVHMTSIGHPLVGDSTYGPRRGSQRCFSRQALHAWKLALRHPTTGEFMEWMSPLPPDLAELVVRLRQGQPGSRYRDERLDRP